MDISGLTHGQILNMEKVIQEDVQVYKIELHPQRRDQEKSVAKMKSSFLCHAIKLETHKPYIAMLFIQLVYAGMALFSKAAIAKGMNPYVFVVYRQAIASLALTPFAYFFESKKAPPLSYNLICKIFMLSLCGITLSLNLYCYAINFTTATLAAATTNTIPAITFIIAVILRMESLCIKKMHGAKVLGSIVGVSGALVYAFVKGPPINFMHSHPTIQNQSIKHSHGGEWVKGSLLMLSANTAWSLWLILQGLVVKEYPAKLRLTALQCIFSCIQSAFWAVAMERNPSSWKIGWDLHLIAVVYCGIVVTGITYWLQVWCVEKKGPVFTSIFTPVALVVTAIFSAFLWKETFYTGSVCGAILLIVGLYGVLWGKTKEWKIVANEQIQARKEETALESITTVS